MLIDPAQVVSAMVIMRSASGIVPDPNIEITEKNIHLFAPDTAAARRMATAFQALGFDVGPLVGISFSITAPARQFIKVFQTDLTQVDDGSIHAEKNGNRDDLELPINNLGNTITENVYRITFTPAADLNSTSVDHLEI